MMRAVERGSLLDWRWLRPPSELSPSGARLFVVRTVGPFIGLAMHAVQALVFLVMGLSVLALASVGSVGIFAGAVALVRSGRARAAMFVSYFEIAVPATVLTFVLGEATGYLVYFLVLTGAPFLVFGSEERGARVFLSGLAMVAAPVVLVIARAHEPLLVLSLAKVEALTFMNVIGGLFGIVGMILYFSAATERAEAETEQAHERTEELLRNVLPEVIAERLKREPGRIADRFDEVTVLFADIVGFTELSARVDSDDLVGLLNDVFSSFDRLADELGLEKIKTIGDAYMVVGGLPLPREDHVAAVAEMALAMRRALHGYAEEHGVELDLRIGLHTGPAVAGVIGERKLAYDLWGDTVNTASRMESHGQPGKIQVSAAVQAALTEGAFVLERRGVVEVKGKGPMETWFLEDATR